MEDRAGNSGAVHLMTITEVIAHAWKANRAARPECVVPVVYAGVTRGGIRMARSRRIDIANEGNLDLYDERVQVLVSEFATPFSVNAAITVSGLARRISAIEYDSFQLAATLTVVDPNA